MALAASISLTTGAKAEDAAAALARKAQNPLADITAIMTDNIIMFGFGPGNDVGYSFQIQPVKSFDTGEGFAIIPRAIIPIIRTPAF